MGGKLFNRVASRIPLLDKITFEIRVPGQKHTQHSIEGEVHPLEWPNDLCIFIRNKHIVCFIYPQCMCVDVCVWVYVLMFVPINAHTRPDSQLRIHDRTQNPGRNCAEAIPSELRATFHGIAGWPSKSSHMITGTQPHKKATHDLCWCRISIPQPSTQTPTISKNTSAYHFDNTTTHDVTACYEVLGDCPPLLHMLWTCFWK